MSSRLSAGNHAVPAGLPQLGVGTAALVLPYGAPGAVRPVPERAAARRTLSVALERGVRLIDTAPAYGQAEALVGETLGAHADCLVATKLAIPPGGWGALDPADVRACVRDSVWASLRALRRERLDLLQIHNADRALMHSSALMDALAELRQEGLVTRIGASVYGEVNALAALAHTDVEVVQIAYNALDRRPECRVLPAAVAAGKTVVARSLLLHGVLGPQARELRGQFAPLGLAADAVRQAFGVSWGELPGAAVAFVADRPGVAWALLGPRGEAELRVLLDQSERLREAAASWQPSAPELADWLLDPSRWPAEVAVGR